MRFRNAASAAVTSAFAVGVLMVAGCSSAPGEASSSNEERVIPSTGGGGSGGIIVRRPPSCPMPALKSSDCYDRVLGYLVPAKNGTCPDVWIPGLSAVWHADLSMDMWVSAVPRLGNPASMCEYKFSDITDAQGTPLGPDAWSSSAPLCAGVTPWTLYGASYILPGESSGSGRSCNLQPALCQALDDSFLVSCGGNKNGGCEQCLQ
jgi:hypothetical protein